MFLGRVQPHLLDGVSLIYSAKSHGKGENGHLGISFFGCLAVVDVTGLLKSAAEQKDQRF